MPKLCPGIFPLFRSGCKFFAALLTVFFPFLLFAQPRITSFSPQSGASGSSVTISGSGFSSTPSSNIVWFGSTKATVTAAGSTTLTVTVPTGASYKPLTVTTAGLTGASAQPFTTTFADPGQFTSDAFSTRQDLSMGTTPICVYTQDLDGDGKPEVLSVSSDLNQLTIFQNTSTTGLISFAQPTTYTPDPGNSGTIVVCGDLDGDGRPDIIVGSYWTPTIAIFRNTSTAGNITLASPIVISDVENTGDLAIADIDGDGKPDIIGASTSDNLVSVYSNNSTSGNISFPSKTDFAVADGGAPQNLAVADFDGDGKPDIATENYNTNNISILHNTSTVGAPWFDTHVDFPVGNSPTGLAAADMDGDGKTDLVVSNNLDNTLSLLLNTCSAGAINFSRNDVATGSGPFNMAVADYDGDGLPDIAVCTYNSNTVSVHKNTSSAGTLSVTSNVDYPTGFTPWWVSASDLDGDGRPDLAVVDNTMAAVTVLRNKAVSEPFISSFTPTSGTTGTTVTINGNHLTGATSVTFGGTAASSFTVVSDTVITAIVGVGSTGSVNVVTPSGVASDVGFTFSLAQPVISSFVPDSAAAGTTVTIKGSAFTTATSVNFGGVPAASYIVVSDTVITAVVGTGESGSLSVATVAGVGSRAGFTFIDSVPPLSLTSFSPAAGGANTDVTITGVHLSSVSGVTFGGTAALSYRIISDSVIHATVGAGSTGAVVVTSSSSTDSLPGFTYITAPPVTISSFKPTTGTAGSTITITGTSLSSVNNVSFGGTAASYFNILSDTVIQAVVGSGSTGSVALSNSNSSTSMPGFVYSYDTTRTSQPGNFQLVAFTGSFSGNQVQLTWQTRDDAIIEYYAIERGSDSTHYDIVGTVGSSAIVNGSATYSFTDHLPMNGTNYYRLRLQDTTAIFNYSKVLQIKTSGSKIYPNPVRWGWFWFDLPATAATSKIAISDMWGRIVQTQVVAAGQAQIRVNMPVDSPPGTYKFVWEDGKNTYMQTILVLPYK